VSDDQGHSVDAGQPRSAEPRVSRPVSRHTVRQEAPCARRATIWETP